MKVGVILLAAGRSRRFGSDKRRAVLDDGQTLLAATVAAIRASGLPLLACLDPADDALATTLADEHVAVARCRDAALGMGHTLAQGVGQRPEDWEGLLVALADMPWVRPDSYRAIAARLAPGNIVAPCFEGRRGNPVGFSSAFYGHLAACSGDRGARDILRQHANAVRELPLDDPGLLRDVDTVAALQRAPGPARY